MRGHVRQLATILVAMAAAVTAGTACAQSALSASQQAELARYGEVREEFSGTRLGFVADSSLYNFTLTVSGPNAYYGQVFSARTVPTFRLADNGDVPDGLYTYSLTAATPIARPAAASAGLENADGRGPNARRQAAMGVSHTGNFRVANGRILELDASAVEGRAQ
ncbi:hypothetical protein [Maricaulis sp.]|uniref:hypothetical protein n=1 Tax=Maricaulis sp. TaxID=1486257 RepID=UPI0025B9ACD3|nr:hypothetical protein [Maricaulis sp.]